MLKFLLIVCAALSFETFAGQEEDVPQAKLIVGVASGFSLVEKLAQIERVINGTGLNVEYVTLPSERSLRALGSGDIAIGIYRQPSAVTEFKDLIQITPAVDSVHFWLEARTPELCNLPPKERFQRTVVGARGLRFFDDYIYPKFEKHMIVNDIRQITFTMAAGRADFSVRTRQLHTEDQWNKYNICDKTPFLTVKFYSYIHKKYSWALPKIIEAYQMEFDSAGRTEIEDGLEP